jgi:hypothetical protein
MQAFLFNLHPFATIFDADRNTLKAYQIGLLLHLCLSVRPSVRPSVRHTSGLCENVSNILYTKRKT